MQSELRAAAPLRVLLVGYGYAGRTFHAPLIRATPELLLAGVVSSDPSKVQADVGAVPVWPDLSQALTAGAYDVVVLATPNALHAEQARLALAHGCHVVVDKPMTLTWAEAEQLAACAQAQQKVLAVFHNRRWDGDFLSLQALLQQGYWGDEPLGDVRTIISHFDRFRPQIRDRWREQAGAGSGLVYDLAPHLLDQALLLWGWPEAICADVACVRPGAATADYLHAVLHYRDAAGQARRYIVHASMLAGVPGPRWTVHGTAGSWQVQGLDPQEEALKQGTWPAGVSPATQSVAWAEQDQPLRPAAPLLAGDYGQFYPQLARACWGLGPNPVPVRQAVAVMALLELLLQSADQGLRLPCGADPR